MYDTQSMIYDSEEVIRSEVLTCKLGASQTKNQALQIYQLVSNLWKTQLTRLLADSELNLCAP